MKIIWPWQAQQTQKEKELKALESHLDAVYQPMAPHPEFAKNLRVQLVGEPQRKKLALPKFTFSKGLLVAGGVVSLIAMLVTGIRIVIAIFGLVQLSKPRKTAQIQV